MRIYEKARDLGIESKDLIDLLVELGLGRKAASSSIDPATEAKIDEHFASKKTQSAQPAKAEEVVETEAEKRRRERREAILKNFGTPGTPKVAPKLTPEPPPEKKPTNVPKTSAVELPPKPKKPKKLKPLRILDTMKVSEYAEAAGVTVRDVLRACMTFGVMATANLRLQIDVIEAISEELGFFPILVDEKELTAPPVEIEEPKVEPKAKPKLDSEGVPEIEEFPVQEAPVKAVKEVKSQTSKVDLAKKPKKKKKKDAMPGDVGRPPVVTVMGHVDHGKTTLLDHIRNANVVAGEKGGITQHIGAYSVETKLGKISFIDTPGHAAFTEMRARGAEITDIVILVVSQEDGIMPQTKEAIDHARAADVPIILAINKMDLPGANPDKVKAELSNYGLMVEDYGGDVLSAEISAIRGDGIQHLLELVALQAEMMELKANPEGPAKGVIIEALLDKFRGSTATLLVKEGTLSRGDSFVAGACYGRIRSMEDERGKPIKKAGPSTPVVITGMNEVPQAGDEFTVVSSDAEARRLAEEFKQNSEKETSTGKSMSLEDFYSLVQGSAAKELPIVLKADVDGSLEAIIGLIEGIGDSEVKVKIIHKAVGGINENDVLLAEASNAVVIAFNSKPDSRSKALAAKKHIDIKIYDVIYELAEDIRAALEGMLEPEIIEEKAGVAEIRQVFKIPKVGVVAGCYIQEGLFRRGFKVQIIRAGEVIGTGTVSALKRFKDDVKEVTAGYECGIEVSGFKDFVEGDSIVAFEVKKITRRLE